MDYLLQLPKWLLLIQWRNSYGLRVGISASTRAEGAHGGPLDSSVPAIKGLPFQKGAPFQHFFHSLVAKFP